MAATAVLLGVSLYLAAGVGTAYLAADDFQWLRGGQTFAWSDLAVGDRDHFFRPVVMLWFAGAVPVCGKSAGCFHALSLAVHAVTIVLVFALGVALFGRRWAAWIGALAFAVQPTYVQAVVWVSAVTGLLAAAWYLAALLMQVQSWRRSRAGPFWQAGAVAAFALAVFSHEAAVTLPAASLLLHVGFAPRGSRWRVLAAGCVVVLAAFAWTTLAANRENYVFTEGHYAAGVHALRHALDYVVSFWVGPHVWPAYLATIAGLIGVLAAGGHTRFAALLMLVTLVPFLGFTWDNVSRYSYLPAVGFSLMLASVWERVADAWTTGRARAGRVLLAVLVVATLVRFAAFGFKGAGGAVDELEAWRAYVSDVVRRDPIAPAVELRVPRPTSPFVDASYVELLLQWVYDRPDLRVTFE